MARIYLVTLARDTPSPFKPKDDEAEESQDRQAEGRAEEGRPPTRSIRKAWRAESWKCPSRQRTTAISPPSAPRSTTSAKAARTQAGLSDVRSGARKETALGSVDGFEISADGKKMIVSQDDKYGIIDLPKGPVTVNEPLNLSAWR